jgi:hypothetical protein
VKDQYKMLYMWLLRTGVRSLIVGLRVSYDSLMAAKEFHDRYKI